MSANHDPKLDVELDRHIGALRDEPVPDGPSMDTLAKTQAMLRDAGADEGRAIVKGGRRTIQQRLVAMTFTQRLAAVVMITLGGLTLYLMFGLFNSLAPVALADVADKFKAARTLVYQTTMIVDGKPSGTSRVLATEPDKMRTESPGGNITITSGQTSLILDPASKTATRQEITRPDGEPAPPKGPHGIVEALRSMGQQKGEPLGEKQIDGVAAVGFRTTAGTMRMEIWADKKTALPVRIEAPIKPGTTVVMEKFQIDPPLDESLFSLDPPAGYTLKKTTFEMPQVPRDVEQAVIELLRGYAEVADGKFPRSLTDWFPIIEASAKAGPKQQNRMIALAGTVTGMTSALDCGYHGDGAKLGEKDKIVFWHRKSEKSPTYRAIYGDLRVEDVTPDKLPTTRP